LKVTAELTPLDAGADVLPVDPPAPEPVAEAPAELAPVDPVVGEDWPDDDGPEEEELEREGSIGPKLGRISLVMRSKTDRATVLPWITSRPALVYRICALTATYNAERRITPTARASITSRSVNPWRRGETPDVMATSRTLKSSGLRKREWKRMG
jgi:hypothetical protein